MPSLRTVLAISALASTAFAAQELVPLGFTKRQDQSFRPGTRPADCNPNCGNLCVFPEQDQECCDAAQSWGCPNDSFCLVDGLCCPDGEDPETCARRNDVELPSDYSSGAPAPTSTPPPYPTPSPEIPSSSVQPTGGLPTPPIPPPEYTGAANKLEGSFLAMGLMVLGAL